MKKSDVIEFFDRCAPNWDADQIPKDAIINRILDNANVGENLDVLDVACGTGVLFPFYLERNVRSVTGIDISHEMARLAAEKHRDTENIRVICGDVEETRFDKQFDSVMVYNAFPHFPDPERLIATLASLLKEGGRLTVAHSASREQIDDHHSGAASKVSNGLMYADELKAIFDPFFDVDIMISNQEMYQVSGVKKAGEIHYHAHSHGMGYHRHGHSHGHGHDHDHHHHAAPAVATPMDEMMALMKFMVAHNEAHAEELAQLAQQLEDAGRRSAYRRVMDAVSYFDMGNATLAAVLDELRRIEARSGVGGELLDTIKLIAAIMDDMRED